MDEIKDYPELGTTEAAVKSFVNLLSVATKWKEEQLAFWLDCYYQLRAAHEREQEDAEVVAEAEKMELLQQLSECGCLCRELKDELKAQQPSTLELRLPGSNLMTAEKFAQEHGVTVDTETVNRPEPIVELEALRRKNVLPQGDLRKISETSKKSSEGQTSYANKQFKQAVMSKLTDARAAGVSIADVTKASRGALSDGEVLTFLSSGRMPLDKYRALDAALDRCAEAAKKETE